MRSNAVAFAFVLAVSFAALAANLGIIEGTVLGDGDRRIAGAKVQLLTRDGRPVDEHVTDPAGHFEFEQVPFGTYRIRAAGADGLVAEQEVRVASGDVLVASISLRPAAEQQVVVQGRRPVAPPPAKVPSSVSSLDREQIEDLPRGDTQSVNEILATQPGFVYDAFGNLFARGNHANIQYQLDGVPLPDSVSGLFGGFLSPKLIDGMEVLTGGLGVEYGQRLAAVVNLNSRRPPDEGEGEVELQAGSYATLNPSVLYGKRMGAWSVLAGGSYRTTDRALDPAVPDLVQHAGGYEERGFLKVEYDPSDRTHVTLLGAYAHNFYRIPIDTTVGPLDPSLPNGGRNPDRYGNDPAPFFPSNTDQTENERDGFALLSVRHDFDPRASLRVALSYRHSYGFLFGDAQQSLGPTQDPCSTDDAGNTSCATTSDVARKADHLGGYAEQLWRVGESVQYLFSPDDLANQGWQFLDHDQRWKASAGATFKEGGRRLSSLFQCGSGLRTGPANDQHVPDHVRVDLGAAYQLRTLPMRPALAVDLVNLFDARYAYRINNGFNGSHWAPGRSIFARVSASF